MAIDPVTTLPPALWTGYAAGKGWNDDNPHATRLDATGHTQQRDRLETGGHLGESRHLVRHEPHVCPAGCDRDGPTAKPDADRLTSLGLRTVLRLDHRLAHHVGHHFAHRLDHHLDHHVDHGHAIQPSEAERFGAVRDHGPFGVPAANTESAEPPVIELRQPAITYAAMRHPTGGFLDVFA